MIRVQTCLSRGGRQCVGVKSAALGRSRNSFGANGDETSMMGSMRDECNPETLRAAVGDPYGMIKYWIQAAGAINHISTVGFFVLHPPCDDFLGYGSGMVS